MPPLARYPAKNGTKICTKCRRRRRVAEFRVIPSRADGRNSHCRRCVNAASADWYRRNREHRLAVGKCYAAANPDRMRAAGRRYYARHSDARRAGARRWRTENPERNRDRERRWREENAEAIRAREQRYRSENPDKFNAKYARRRQRKRERWVDAVKLDVLYARDHGQCRLCNRSCSRADASVDHVVPLSRGGEHSYANAQLAHQRCNARKGAADVAV